MEKSEATVFIVDDDAAMLKSLTLLIKSINLNVETYLSATDFLDNYDPARPGCLVLDIRMPGMSGLELQEALDKRDAIIPTIVITGHADVPVAVQAMKRGAVDFLEKPFSDQVLLDQVGRAVAMDAEIRKERTIREAVKQRIELLTPREREVMNLVISGKLNKVIAQELGLSQKTVEFHRARVMKKMMVDSVAELVMLVTKAGHNP